MLSHTLKDCSVMIVLQPDGSPTTETSPTKLDIPIALSGDRTVVEGNTNTLKFSACSLLAVSFFKTFALTGL